MNDNDLAQILTAAQSAVVAANSLVAALNNVITTSSSGAMTIRLVSVSS